MADVAVTAATPAAPAPLAPADVEEIHTALVKGYDIPQLDRLLRFKWGVRLEEETGTSGGSKKVFLDLIDWTEREGRTRDLLALAWSNKPGNDYLRAAAERLLPSLDKAADLYQRGNIPPPPDSLEALVTSRSVLVSYDDYLARYQALGARICRVETTGKQGTGFLIGARTVLTNFHVVEAETQNLSLGEAIVCRFDFHGGGAGLARRLVRDGPWLGPTSRYSQSDLTGRGDPGPGELDFAVLYLEEPMEPERGSWSLPDSAAVVLPGDVVVVAQHPGGEKLALAYGAVVAFPASGLRYRYTCTTAPGASGAPLLSADLQLVGLHHAAEPDSHPDFNQAIPIHLVGRGLKAAGLDLGAL